MTQMGQKVKGQEGGVKQVNQRSLRNPAKTRPRNGGCLDSWNNQELFGYKEKKFLHT